MDLEQKISVLMQRNAVLEKRGRWQEQESERLRKRIQELEGLVNGEMRADGDSFGLDPTKVVQEFLKNYLEDPRDAATQLLRKLQSIQVRASQFSKKFEDLEARFRTMQQNYLSLRKQHKEEAQD